MANPYFDLKTELFKKFYDQGRTYEDYLRTGKPHEIEKWESYAGSIVLSPAQLTRISAFRRQMPVLVMSGIWCGDCMRQGPMLRAIEAASPHLTMRYVDNRENPELQNELRINGAEKVPVVVTFSENFYELNRFGDRHLSVYRRKLQNELGVACDPGFGSPAHELAEELEEWVCHFERLQAIVRLAPLLRKRYND